MYVLDALVTTCLTRLTGRVETRRAKWNVSLYCFSSSVNFWGKAACVDQWSVLFVGILKRTRKLTIWF